MASTPELESIVGGKYRLVRALGAGGMGTVYEAENVLTLKRAAIKWLHPQFAGNEQAYQRVIHEARASSRIRHENVVDVYDVVHEGDSIFLVMELLVGEPFSDLLAREPPPMHELIALLLPAMRGLAAAHAAGVVHRDIKPENIFLAQKPGYSAPVPKIIDFGISKVFDLDGANLTRSGVTMGTPKYVSYEQLMGARDVDPRTDVYAFGVILYEALTGRAPYQGAKTFGEQAIYFATTVPASPRSLRPEVPEALDALVMQALAKERDERCPSLDALVHALEPFARISAYPLPLPSFPPHATEHAALAEAPTTPTRTPAPTVSSAELPKEVPPSNAPTPTGPRRTLPARARRGAWALVAGATLAIASLLWAVTRSAPVREAPQPRRASSGAHPGRTVDETTETTERSASQTAAVNPPEPADAHAPFPAMGEAHSPNAPAPRLHRGPKIESRAPLAEELPSESHALPAEQPDAGSSGAPLRGDPPATEDVTHRAGRLRRQEF